MKQDQDSDHLHPLQANTSKRDTKEDHIKSSKTQLEDRFLYSGGTESLENFAAGFSASAPVVYKNPPPMGPEILYTTGAGEGVKVSVAIFPSSGGGV